MFRSWDEGVLLWSKVPIFCHQISLSVARCLRSNGGLLIPPDDVTKRFHKSYHVSATFPPNQVLKVESNFDLLKAESHLKQPVITLLIPSLPQLVCNFYHCVSCKFSAKLVYEIFISDVKKSTDACESSLPSLLVVLY